MSILQVLPFIPDSIHRDNRRKACRTCPFAVVVKVGEYSGRWCGSPLMGDVVVNEQGKEIKLCGCNIKFKSKVNEEKCPDNRWEKV